MKPFLKLLVLFLVVSVEAMAQANTPNIGFEEGTFDHWECYTGLVGPDGTVSVSPTPPTFRRQTIYGKESASLLDRFGLFPVLCPNGSNYSIQLGSEDTSKEAERVTYTFTVPKGNAYSIIFNYAVVLENPRHLSFQQPKFTAQVYDVTDDKYIDCPSFDFVASSDLPGFKLSKEKGPKGEPIFYKDWSTATIDLRGYLGKTIRLEFTANDCTLGGHFGYAYLDLDENVGSSISGNTYCAGQKSITLYAPNGFAAYDWYNADFSKQIGTGQSITISPPPPDLTTYAIKILPYPELGCVDTVYTVIYKNDESFKLSVLDTIYGCPAAGVDLTAATVTAGSSPGMALSYFTDSLATSYLYNPNAVTTTGVYYIQGINKEGCMNVFPVHVIVALPDINVANPPPVIYPATVDLSKTYTPQLDVSYSYYSNSEATTPVENYTAIQYSGKFYIKATNSHGCTNVAPVNVVVNPPLPYTITAPNVFTPNNDGINDHFNVTIAGIATFESVKIYNRYGQLIFSTTSPTEYWDGTYNGRIMPVGTYYWVFDGRDDYYHTKITRAAAITLLR